MTTRKSFNVTLARLAQKLPLKVFRPVESCFVGEYGSAPKVISIFALPRSGSTLTYQALIHAFGLQYLSNLGNLFYQLPLAGGKLSNIRCTPHSSEFTSSHGFVSGLCGPAEGLKFWEHWMGVGLNDEDIGSESAFRKKKQYLVRCFAKLTYNKPPIVTGYLGHALLPERVFDYFPDVFAIRVVRDPIANALSIMKCVEAGDSTWFSVIPKECNDLDSAEVHERIANQVYWLNKRLDLQLEDKSVFLLRYEQLCETPNQVIEKCEAGARAHGFDVSLVQELPPSFRTTKKGGELNTDVQKFTEVFTKLEREHGVLKHNSVIGSSN